MYTIDLRFDGCAHGSPVNAPGTVAVTINDEKVTEYEHPDGTVVEGIGSRPLLIYHKGLSELLSLCHAYPVSQQRTRTVTTNTVANLNLSLDAEGILRVGLDPARSKGSEYPSPTHTEVTAEFGRFCQEWLNAYEQVRAYLDEMDIEPDHPDMHGVRETHQELAECLDTRGLQNEVDLPDNS